MIAPENTVSILWQLPAVVVITVAEILLSVSGPEFAYQEVVHYCRYILPLRLTRFSILGLQRAKVSRPSGVVAEPVNWEYHHSNCG